MLGRHTNVRQFHVTRTNKFVKRHLRIDAKASLILVENIVPFCLYDKK